MPTVNHVALEKSPAMQHAYGNLAYKSAKVTMPIGSAAADLINFMRLRKGMKLIDGFAKWDGGNSAATTMKLGLAAVAGGLTSQVDDDYFILAATDLNAANGRQAFNNPAVYQITLDSDYYVQATLAGTTSATLAMDIEVTVFYEFVGNL